MPEQHKRTPNINCAICGKQVYRRPCEIEKSKGKLFCSVACYGVSCRKEIPCIVCGKLILASFHKKTCCRGCSNKHRAGIKYKIGSPKDKVKSQQALKIRLLRSRGKKCERWRSVFSKKTQYKKNSKNKTEVIVMKKREVHDDIEWCCFKKENISHFLNILKTNAT